MAKRSPAARKTQTPRKRAGLSGDAKGQIAALRHELAEAREQLAATASILRSVASTPKDAECALHEICDTAQRLFGASNVGIRRIEGLDGNLLRSIASAGSISTQVRNEMEVIWFDPLSPLGMSIAEKRVIHIRDAARRSNQEQAKATASGAWSRMRALGVRSNAVAPLLREGVAIGAIAVNRTDVRPFTDRELALLQSFADQAVIAIENARLLSELRESLDRRTAIAEVLQVISSSPGDVQPVFETMLESAVRLCDASNGSIFRIEGDLFRRVTSVNLSEELAAQVELRFPADFPAGRMLASKGTVHIPDALAELEERPDHPTLKIAAERSGSRNVLWVPILKDGEVMAAFVLSRTVPGAFTDSQIGLVENFAQQAVIAIENARLFAELREARDAAERALVDLRAAQANLVQAEKMASLGQLTAGIAHEIKNPLNFVNNFAGLSVELLDELKEAQAAAIAALDAGKQAEIDEIASMLTSNLEKIAEHGQRADGIVKSMLAHSRGGSSEWQDANLNALVEEALNLAYHGARAQDQSFNITLERDLDPEIGPIEVVPQELMRVFLNLFGNGFYAANKREKEKGDGSFSPTLKVTTREADGGVEIRIRDNGVGIPADHLPRLFEPFFTTKPTGEGTGLGLSISYEIVTQQHGGEITVESEPGAFTEFTVTIPRRA